MTTAEATDLACFREEVVRVDAELTRLERRLEVTQFIFVLIFILLQ